MTNYQDPSRWWGGEGRAEGRLSLLDLIRNNTLDVDTAALLWLLVENKSSVIVASMPQLAGKTTLLSALMDFAPPRYERVYANGQDEDFSFLNHTAPSNTYILIPELSDHTPAYLWGDAVQTLFKSLGQGYSMAATMHADTPEQVLDMLAGYPVYISRDVLHHVDLIVNIKMSYSERDMLRLVNRVTLVSTGANLVTLAEWDSTKEAITHFNSPDARAELEKRISINNLDAAISQRKETLEYWLKQDQASASDVQQMVVRYYESEHQ